MQTKTTDKRKDKFKLNKTKLNVARHNLAAR